MLWEPERDHLRHHLTERAQVIKIDLNPVLDDGEWAIGGFLSIHHGHASIMLYLAESDEDRWAGELAEGNG